MMNVYAIYDKKTAFSQELLVMPNDDVAKRYFGNFVAGLAETNKSAVIVSYPEDFDFYRIGSYNPDSGEIISCKPEFLLNAGSIIGKE